MKNRTNFFTDRLRVFHVSPMTVFQRRCKRLRNLRYVSGDIDYPLAMVKMDIQAIPFKENQFDCLICSHVLEHVHDDRKAMKELFRVLKPDGWAIIQSFIDPAREQTLEDTKILSPYERVRIFGQEDHLRTYGRDYRHRLQQAGFHVKVDNYAQEMESSNIARYGLVRDMDIYFCTKPDSGQA